MRVSSWPVTMAGSIDSGSAPLRMTSSARLPPESQPAIVSKIDNNNGAQTRPRKVANHVLSPAARVVKNSQLRSVALAIFFGVGDGKRVIFAGYRLGAGDAGFSSAPPEAGADCPAVADGVAEDCTV